MAPVVGQGVPQPVAMIGFSTFRWGPTGRQPTGIQGPPSLMESNRERPACDPRATTARPIPAWQRPRVGPPMMPPCPEGAIPPMLHALMVGLGRPCRGFAILGMGTQGVALSWHEAAPMGVRALGPRALGAMPSRTHAPGRGPGGARQMRRRSGKGVPGRCRWVDCPGWSPARRWQRIRRVERGRRRLGKHPHTKRRSHEAAKEERNLKGCPGPPCPPRLCETPSPKPAWTGWRIPSHGVPGQR